MSPRHIQGDELEATWQGLGKGGALRRGACGGENTIGVVVAHGNTYRVSEERKLMNYI